MDHLVVSATTLEDGAAQVEEALGVKLQPGGRHDLMGTHNRLLGLGPAYLEVIAIDPEAVPPHRPRWYDLDRFAGATRLTNWAVQTEDLDNTLHHVPPGTGEPINFARGDLRWQMAVPDNGRLPFDGAFPAIIQWYGDLHPCNQLTDVGCRLIQFYITHPDAENLQLALAACGLEDLVSVNQGPEKRVQAAFQTPSGVRYLG